VIHVNVFSRLTQAERLRIKERLRIRWEMTAVNIPNHPNYNDPQLNISSAGTGLGWSSDVSEQRCDNSFQTTPHGERHSTTGS